MTKVSVIMPIYNAEDFLAEALNSLMRQNFSDVEFVCVNDGSTDNSIKIFHEIVKDDERFKLLEQINSGSAKARNVGMDHATGEYICFMDSDDIMEDDALETMYNLSKN